MKSEDFLRCLGELDDDLIREAAEDSGSVGTGTELLECMNDLDDDLVAEAAGMETADKKRRPGIGRARVVSISSRFMKAAAVALLIGAASMSAISYSNSGETEGIAGQAASEVSEPEKENRQSPASEKKDSESRTKSGSEKDTEPVQTSPDRGRSSETKDEPESPAAAKRDTSSTQNEKSSERKTDAAAANAGNSGEAKGTKPQSSAKENEEKRQAVQPDSTSQKQSNMQQNAADSTPEKQNQQKPAVTEQASYGKASYNGNSYYANHTETPSWKLGDYLGTVELSSRESEDSLTGEAYSIAGTGGDHEIAVRIGNSDTLYTYVAADETESGENSVSTQSEADSGAESSESEAANSDADEHVTESVPMGDADPNPAD